jgi:hypothetical protein
VNSFRRFASPSWRFPSRGGIVVGGLGVDPGFAARCFDLFPERRAGFQVVHKELRSSERRFTVGRRRYHEDNVFSRHDTPVSMNNGDAQQGPTADSLCDVSFDLGFGHAGIMLECKRGYWLVVLGASADSGKRHNRADVSATARQLRHFRGGVERLALQAYGRFHALNVARSHKRGYPPVMGGKNAISPAPLIAASGCT